MSELLKIILSLSLSGTLLFFILLLLKPLCKNKLSKRWQYYVWLIVIARMLVPFTPETTLVGAVFQRLQNINVETIQTTPSTNDTQASFDLDKSDMSPNGQPQAPQSNMDTTPSIFVQAIFTNVYENLWILWAAIAFALWVRKITMYQGFVRFVKAGQAEVSDIEILNMLADIGETVGVKRPVELFTNPIVSSPMLLGFFRPYIILPSIALDSAELAYIMRHELTHYKHLDMFYKWLVQITVCLHWFNPFAYLMAKEINKCCELSCDEAIIRTMDKDEKKAYGDTLLNSLKAMGNYNDKLATVTLTEGAEQLKERLDAIMKFKQKSKSIVAITLALTTMLCVGATVVGAYAAPQTAIPQMPATINTSNKAEQAEQAEGSYDKDYATGRTTTSNIQEIKEIPVNATKITTLELTGESGTYTDGSICVSGNGYIVFDVQLQSGSMKELAIQNAWTNEVLYSIDKPKTALYSGIFSKNKVDSEYKFSFVEAKKLQGSITVYYIAEHTTKAEADEILSDLEQNPAAKEDIKRLTLEEVPDAIQSAVNSCDDKTWYIIEGHARKYIYYNNLPHNYAYQYEPTKNSISIVDIGKSTGNYVLLSVPLSSNLTISYNFKSVTYKNLLGTVSGLQDTNTNTPWSAMGGTGQLYTYSQQGYYQGNYIFELGWNLNTKGYDAYSDKSNVTLSDGSTITVSFDRSCKSEAQDNAVLADLMGLVERLKKQYANSSTPLEKPLVVRVSFVGDSDLVELAEEYYANDKLTSFSAIFSSLDTTIQKEYCTKMITDEKNAFLSSAAKSMELDMIVFCLEKTYQEGKIALFAGIVPYLTDDQKETWATRASRDQKNTFLAVLTS